MWTIGTDTGGTFTDLVAIDDEGRIRVTKTPSTPPEFQTGVVNALSESGISPDEICALRHGTTVTTNALLTRNGVRTALLTTDGFRDVLELRNGSRAEYYDVGWDPPTPLVERVDRLPIPERVDYRGEVLVPLDEQRVREAAATLRERGVEAVAVAFIHAYANPAHERRAAELLREELPGVFVCTSSDVLPEPPEFVRTSTVVANAYVGPVLERYMARLEQAVADYGYDRGIVIMHSGGGSMTPRSALRLPVRTAMSGPAAGVMAAAAIAQATGRANAVSLDVGGTSADIATIHDGEPRTAVEQQIEWGLPVGFPAIDVIAIGSGGGSIAWVDDAGAPHVGPQSSSALPGPACYSRGGVEPTTTDANVVLGRLRPRALLGGEMELDVEKARVAVTERFADRLGLDLHAAAEGIVRIANEHMAHGIRQMTIQRGLDPREFSLIAFGGAGPAQAVEVAQLLQMPEVIVPAHPGTTSALGLLTVDARHDLVRSLIRPADAVDPVEVEGAFSSMEDEIRELLLEDGFMADDIRLDRTLELRYEAQERALALPVPAGTFDAAALEAVITAFHDRYEQEYKYAVRDQAVELKSVRLAGVGVAVKPQFGELPTDGEAEAARVGEQDVWFDGQPHRTTFYSRERLGAGARFSGPAVVEQYDSTTVVPPGTEAEVDPTGNLILRIGA